jgi:cytochrome c-type biogenesis protein CcmH/NrfG
LTEAARYRIGAKWAAAIFAAALIYRAVCFLDAGAHPLFRYPVVDAALHDQWAQRIVAGQWLGQVDDVAKPPLYPYFVAAIYGMFGREVAVVQWVQLVLGAVSAALIAMIGARLLGRAAGCIAGFLAAFYAPLVFFELQLVTPALSIFLNLAAMLALLGTMRDDPDDGLSQSGPASPPTKAEVSPSTPSLPRVCLLFFVAGVLLGLSAGVRPDVLLPGCLVAGYVLWGTRSQVGSLRSRDTSCVVTRGGATISQSADGTRSVPATFPAVSQSADGTRSVPATFPAVDDYLWGQRRAAWGRLAARVAFLAAGLSVVLVPIALRNHAITGRFILVSSNAGMNFYIGNCTEADGISSVPVGLRWERIVSRMPQEVLEDPVAASRWWTDAAWQEIKASPSAFLGRLGKKALAFFNAREFRNNICYHFFLQTSPSLRWGPVQLGIVFPLAAWGLLRLWRGRTIGQRRAFFVCVLWIAGYWAAAVVYFVCARYRLPAAPFLLLPVAWGCLDIVDAVGRRAYRSLLACAGVILVAGAICWPAWFGRPQDGWTLDFVNFGNCLREAGDIKSAANAYKAAIKCDAHNPDAHYLLAQILAVHDPRAAVESLKAAQDIVPDSSTVLLALAQAHLILRERAAAVEYLNKLLDEAARSNFHPFPLRHTWALAHVLLAQLKPGDSEVHWKEAWAIDPAAAAEMSLMQGRDLPRVLETFEDAARKRPWDWYAHANYGTILMRMDRPSDAVAAFRAASRLSLQRQRPTLRYHLALALFRGGKSEESLWILNELARTTSGQLRKDVNALRTKITEGRQEATPSVPQTPLGQDYLIPAK